MQFKLRTFVTRNYNDIVWSFTNTVQSVINGLPANLARLIHCLFVALFVLERSGKIVTINFKKSLTNPFPCLSIVIFCFVACSQIASAASERTWNFSCRGYVVSAGNSKTTLINEFVSGQIHWYKGTDGATYKKSQINIKGENLGAGLHRAQSHGGGFVVYQKSINAPSTDLLGTYTNVVYDDPEAFLFRIETKGFNKPNKIFKASYFTAPGANYNGNHGRVLEEVKKSPESLRHEYDFLCNSTVKTK